MSPQFFSPGPIHDLRAFFNFIFIEFVLVDLLLILGQGQLTVKGTSNRMLPRFLEPILG